MSEKNSVESIPTSPVPRIINLDKPEKSEENKLDEKKSQKEQLLQKWLDDENVDEVILIGRFKSGGYVWEHTFITNAFEIVGFIMSHINKILQGLWQ